MSDLANSILKAFALTLGLPSEDYFEQFTDHHGSAMRALNYPSLDGQTPVPGQIRASAHTVHNFTFAHTCVCSTSFLVQGIYSHSNNGPAYI